MIQTTLVKTKTGFSFRDQQGNKPQDYSFSFNMRFNLDEEEQNKASIDFLKEKGTDFNKLRDEGCDQQEVVHGLKDLLGDETITWVTFQGRVYNF